MFSDLGSDEAARVLSNTRKAEEFSAPWRHSDWAIRNNERLASTMMSQSELCLSNERLASTMTSPSMRYTKRWKTCLNHDVTVTELCEAMKYLPQPWRHSHWAMRSNERLASTMTSQSLRYTRHSHWVMRSDERLASSLTSQSELCLSNGRLVSTMTS